MKSSTIVVGLAAVITVGGHRFSHRMLWLAAALDCGGLCVDAQTGTDSANKECQR